MDLIKELQNIKEKGNYAVIYGSDLKVLKKNRKTKEKIPEKYLNITKLTYKTISIGNDYENLVNNRLKKENKESNFESQSTYCLPINEDKILYRHKEKEQYYLRCYLPTKGKNLYIDSNGELLSDIEIKDIYENYMTEKKENTNQELDNPIQVLNIKIENIFYLKRGNFEFKALQDNLLKLFE